MWLKIWFPSIFRLLFDEGDEIVEFMTPTPKVSTVGVN
jgi:hypothetical protein